MISAIEKLSPATKALAAEQLIEPGQIRHGLRPPPFAPFARMDQSGLRQGT